ncbi:transposase [Streptomyces sp900105245]|uniref:Transposase n=1 Tax=Streptomyces sp. 900105245 TaxID=3154379 RepID=A0ABV1UMC5_9ACTN
MFAINPLAMAREVRLSVARTKSDAIDAAALANILRIDMAAHRPLTNDSELAQAIAVLARAQQDAVWDRVQAHNKLCSQLREFYPAILAAFADEREGICSPKAWTILAAATTPTAAARLTHRRLQSLLKQAGRLRGIEAEADRLDDVLHREYLHQPPQVEEFLASRQPHCLVSWKLSVPMPTSSKLLQERLSSNVQPPRLSPAFWAWGPSPGPGPWPTSAVTGLVSRTPER